MATHDHDFAVTAGARIVPLADGRITGETGEADDRITADDGITRPGS